MEQKPLTVADIKRIAEMMKERAIPAKRIETQEEADRANAIDARWGLKDGQWKVGDEYYEWSDFQRATS